MVYVKRLLNPKLYFISPVIFLVVRLSVPALGGLQLSVLTGEQRQRQC